VHFARVVGKLVATVKDESLVGRRLLVVQPLDEAGEDDGAPYVAVDTVSAAPGQKVMIVKSREGAKALPGKFAPVDAAIVGLVDRVTRHESKP
jgi:ethanolamine utilization protein EutN